MEDSQDQHEGNKDAARALMRVRQKLDGYEEGELRSVNGQVILPAPLANHLNVYIVHIQRNARHEVSFFLWRDDLVFGIFQTKICISKQVVEIPVLTIKYLCFPFYLSGCFIIMFRSGDGIRNDHVL